MRFSNIFGYFVQMIIVLAERNNKPAGEAPPLVTSTLFGDNDPLTMDWIVGLCRSDGQTALSKDEVTKVLQRIRDLTKVKLDFMRHIGPEDFKLGRIYQFPTGDEADHSPSDHETHHHNDLPNQERRHSSSGDEFVTHVWPVLRVARLALNCEGIDDLDSVREILFRYFAAELAQQLGFADVRDSSFDIARLVFALDGLTLCKASSLHAGLLHRSIEIILNTHKVDPKLQPRRPFKVTPTGGVHIPITVEVFQSIIRIVRRLSPRAEQFSALQHLLPVLRRYTEYLQASIVDVQLRDEDQVYTGWASDHEFSSSAKIETWYTSQVVLYLLMYGALIRDHAAHVHLNEANLQVKSVEKHINAFFRSDETLKKLADDFSLCDVSNRSMWSLLLYGPPGTGKTTIVEQIAKRVEWPILELSPSHFVDRGVDRVEERAAQLFRILTHQNEVVVLFDEIDRLVLDRSSEEYGDQGDMFQFMTPSMLTKLNSLRRNERVIFAIATNYAWRIDSAILRPGRVDHSYLILPPNAHARRNQIRTELPDLPEDALEELGAGTVLASWTEIKAFCKSIRSAAGSMSRTQARAATGEVSPTIQLRNYDRDLRMSLSGKPAEYLFKEILGLYELLAEVSTEVEVLPAHAPFIREHMGLLQSISSERAERLSRWLPVAQ